MSNWRNGLVVWALLLIGCPIDRNGDGRITVACIEDSNTMARWPVATDPTTRWCERLAAQYPGWVFRNYAMIGASTYDVTPGFPFPRPCGWPVSSSTRSTRR